LNFFEKNVNSCVIIITNKSTMPPSKKDKSSNNKKSAATGIVTPPNSTSPSPPSSITTTTTTTTIGNKSTSKSSTRLTPEDFPDILVTHGTNEKKIHDNARDILIEGLTVQFHGTELIKDATLALAYGQRYALCGLNGSGKTTLLNVVAARMVPIAKGLDIYSVHHPISPSDLSALEAVLEVDEERRELETEADRLGDAMTSDGISDEEQAELSDRLNEVYERLEAMDAASATSRASNILKGLGFTKAMQEKKTRDFSGGWRMRIALARALFINPSVLVLDG
jgi:ATP-binding cassette subfamily F protein 2